MLRRILETMNMFGSRRVKASELDKVHCAICGSHLRVWPFEPIAADTQTGKVLVEESKVECPGCRKTHFPVRRQVGGKVMSVFVD